MMLCVTRHQNTLDCRNITWKINRALIMKKSHVGVNLVLRSFPMKPIQMNTWQDLLEKRCSNATYARLHSLKEVSCRVTLEFILKRKCHDISILPDIVLGFKSETSKKIRVVAYVQFNSL